MPEQFPPQIYAYDPEHLYSGLTFSAVAIKLVHPEELRATAIARFGKFYDSPYLATKGGIEHPVLIYVDHKLLSFVPGIKFGYVKPEERPSDPANYAIKQREIRGDEPLPEELRGMNFEIWALNRYPTPEGIIWHRFEDTSSPLFDPNVAADELIRPVHEIYQGLVKYYTPLAEQQ